jgi:hypothetical protein
MPINKPYILFCLFGHGSSLHHSFNFDAPWGWMKGPWLLWYCFSLLGKFLKTNSEFLNLAVCFKTEVKQAVCMPLKFKLLNCARFFLIFSPLSTHTPMKDFFRSRKLLVSLSLQSCVGENTIRGSTLNLMRSNLKVIDASGLMFNIQ